MIGFSNRSGGARFLMAVCSVAVLAAACDFHYRAAVEPVSDEVVVRTVPDPGGEYAHPARLSAQELTSILQEVRVQFKSNWLQRLITGPLEPVPLFDEAALARVVPPLAETLKKADAHDRVVFYVAQRKADDRRDVTSGALFVQGRGLTIALVNHQNRVDVVLGLTAYDRQTPEVAVAPQRFSLVFDRNEFVIEPEREDIGAVLGAAPPQLIVDYAQFLQRKAQAASDPGIAVSKKASR